MLRPDATKYEVLHELQHAKQFGELLNKSSSPKAAWDAWKKFGELKREQMVYDAMRDASWWVSLSKAEQNAANTYIREIGGVAR